MKWYQNRYVQAFAVAVATGLVAAAGVYLATMTDGLDVRHTIKTVGTAFLAPFAVLVSVLPKITDIITPKVTLISKERLSSLPTMAGQEYTMDVSGQDGAVIVDPPAPRAPLGGTPQRPADTTFGSETTVRSHHRKTPLPAIITPVDTVADS
jgi:hypothetical protein